jgi:type IV pilus assembly protein PilQ
MEITGYRDRDLGIRLSVTPQINVQNEIVVTVYPQITNLVGYDDLTADIRAPRFSTREAKTQVRIKSGQTIAIGGLIKENSVKTTTKFPLLGDMPLLDKFFKHEDTSVDKTDLLFFITVNVVNDKNPAPQGHKL